MKTLMTCRALVLIWTTPLSLASLGESFRMPRTTLSVSLLYTAVNLLALPSPSSPSPSLPSVTNTLTLLHSSGNRSQEYDVRFAASDRDVMDWEEADAPSEEALGAETEMTSSFRSSWFEVSDIRSLIVNMTSETSGIVTSSETLCGKLVFYCTMDASYTVVVPEGHVTMISFPKFIMEWAYYSTNFGFAELRTVAADGSTSVVWRTALRRSLLPTVYQTSVRVRVFVPVVSKLTKGFQMRFSIHPASQAPPTLSPGVFDCAVPFYPTFAPHLDCDLRQDCEGGEDEVHTAPSLTRPVQGVAVEGKCFAHLYSNQTLTWEAARRDCRKRGGDLASLTTPRQWQAFRRLLRMRHVTGMMYVGLQSYRPPAPAIYRRLYTWLDGTTNYGVTTRVDDYTRFFHRICFMHKGTSRYQFLYYIPCDEYLYRDSICQTILTNTTSNASILLPPPFPPPNGSVNASSFFESNGQERSALDVSSSYVTCQDGHVTLDFLSCDPRSHCGVQKQLTHCLSPNGSESSGPGAQPVAMFSCQDSSLTLHYTLVCDFRPDCRDASDEEWCVHRAVCHGFHCRSGQCILPDKQCDGVSDCWDASDEECTVYLLRESPTYLVAPPAEIFFDSELSVTLVGRQDTLCLTTHYLCPEGYCLPLYTRCNGVADCAGREDEADCEHVQCPGLYRCLSSSVCLHAEQLCDGWPQCPQRDDEWLCNTTCPWECRCQGHAFVCSHNFSTAPYPHLRYLDAGGSGMSPADVTGLSYLVWLRLAGCGLREVGEVDLDNLRTLDLSHNLVDFLATDVFLPLKNLRELDLSHNPLSSLVSHSGARAQFSLTTVRLSRVSLAAFNSSVLAGFPAVRTLNLSHTRVTAISSEGFRHCPSLRVLDLRGSDVSDYPRDVFLNHTHLRAIWADNYKLCCREVLPESFPHGQCQAPVDEISSCDDLLRSNSYRAFLWMFSVLSIVGNVGSLISRLFLVRGKSGASFNTFVTHLSMADLIMGLYLALVGAADHVYRGRYFWFEKTWKGSVACQIAGFLSLLSSEVSAFIICLITLDRFLVLSSPFSEVRFKPLSTAVACVLAWTLGLCLALVPLLPGPSHWHFYSQTGICIPLPITRGSFKGRNYAFGIMIIFNLVLFVLIAVGQALIYHSIRTSASLALSSTRKSKDLTVARRLVSVVLSDFLCWFPMGVLGVLATAGTPIPGEVNVGMAIFVLPLNAALNPFLYTFNALMERWRARQEARLLKQLEACSQEVAEK